MCESECVKCGSENLTLSVPIEYLNANFALVDGEWEPEMSFEGKWEIESLEIKCQDCDHIMNKEEELVDIEDLEGDLDSLCCGVVC